MPDVATNYNGDAALDLVYLDPPFKPHNQWR
jgi:16S rRNA G966 N2-methylase RsmD